MSYILQMDKLGQTLNNCKQHAAKIGIRASLQVKTLEKLPSISSIFNFLNIKGKANNPSKQNKVKFCPVTEASNKSDLPHMSSSKFNGFTHIKTGPSNK